MTISFLEKRGDVILQQILHMVHMQIIPLVVVDSGILQQIRKSSFPSKGLSQNYL